MLWRRCRYHARRHARAATRPIVLVGRHRRPKHCNSHARQIARLQRGEPHCTTSDHHGRLRHHGMLRIAALLLFLVLGTASHATDPRRRSYSAAYQAAAGPAPCLFQLAASANMPLAANGGPGARPRRADGRLQFAVASCIWLAQAGESRPRATRLAARSAGRLDSPERAGSRRMPR